jgi:hypothetical protein
MKNKDNNMVTNKLKIKEKKLVFNGDNIASSKSFSS